MDLKTAASLILKELSNRKNPVILGIDGPAASGKTGLALQIQKENHAPIVHLDDFFIPFSKRALPKDPPFANIDGQKFREEVLFPIKENKAFSYRPYDCHSGKYSEEIFVPKTNFLIIEGSYALHPDFLPFYTDKILLQIDKEEQRKRILNRNGERAFDFFEKWIPMEDAYFEHCFLMTKEIKVVHITAF